MCLAIAAFQILLFCYFRKVNMVRSDNWYVNQFKSHTSNLEKLFRVGHIKKTWGPTPLEN
jgi:hypothetical protein